MVWQIFNVREVSIHRTKSPPSPVHDTSDDGSTGSSGESTCTQDHSTQASDSVASSPSVASPIMTPLLRTFDTFRRELQVITGSVSSTLALSPGRNAKDATKSKLPERGSSRTATFSSRNSTSSLPSPTNSLEAKPAVAEPANETRPGESSSRTHSFSIPQPSSVPKAGPTASPSKLVLMRTARVSTFSSPGSGSLRPEPVSVIPEPSPVATWPVEEDLDLLNAVAAVAPVPVRDPDQSSAPKQEDEETTMIEPFDSPSSTGNAFFFRRWNVGKPLQRRASMSSTSPSLSGSGPTSGSSSPSGSSISSNARVAELERELCAMKTNHENVVAVLRATNKQHAANVLELRAQVAALTDGNNWLNKQLASKNALVQELRQMEKHDRISRADVENLLALKDTQIRTLEKEIAKLKKQVQRIETEKDSILCQQVKHFRARQERDEDRIDRLREDVLSMVTCLSSYGCSPGLSSNAESVYSAMNACRCRRSCMTCRRCRPCGFN